MADQTRNHPMAQGPLSDIIRGRQIRLLQNRPDRLPVMEKLARQGPGFLMTDVPVQFTERFNTDFHEINNRLN